MMQSFIHEILRDYEITRDRSKDLRDKRLNEVYEKIPKIEKIDEELQKTGINISKALIMGVDDPEKTIESFKVAINKLKQDRAFLLTENNIPMEYLDQHYMCTSCKDTGFVPSGHKCKCFKQKLISRAYNMSNLSNILEKENFKNFDMTLFSDEIFEGQDISPKQNMMEILNISEGFTFNFEENKEENLLFYGDTGLGKTFLTNCIAKALLDRGKIVIYQTAFKLLEILGDLRFRNSNKDKYDLLFEADLLIIDDLGTEMTNTFTNSELFNIINSRLLSNKKTIISTNLSPKEMMDRYDDRIFSRLFSMFTVLHFYGKDLRWETKGN